MTTLLTQEIPITGMTCAACVRRVENAVAGVAGVAAVEGARLVTLDGEAHQNADHRGCRHGEKDPYQTEQRGPGEGAEYYPDRVQPNPFADQLGR